MDSLGQAWRGRTEKGGSSLRRTKSKISENGVLRLAMEGLSVREASESDPGRSIWAQTQSYTFANVPCGAGDASWGVKYAGLHISWALDHDEYACETYRYTFPDVTCHENDIKVVASVGDKDLKVDIMNISLPCQAYSEAHTTVGKMTKISYP